MENTVRVAVECGYLDLPPDTLLPIDQVSRLPDHEALILTTGSQGEPMSALTRISVNDHRRVEIKRGDTVIIAATPVPGNEKLVNRTIDNLYKRGANVIYGSGSGVHVSGHGSIEELKLMYNLVRPRFFMPIHGEFRHLVHHAQMAASLGTPEDNIFVGENGTVFEFGGGKGRRAGRVSCGNVLVDGSSVGDVGNIVLRERRQLALDGMVLVVLTIDRETGALRAGPDVLSRGFVFVRDNDELMDEIHEVALQTINKCQARNITEWQGIKSQIRDQVSRFVLDKTRRRPVVIPFVQEI